NGKIFWSNHVMVGVVTTTATWLIFVLEYTGQTQWLRPNRRVLIAIHPVVMILLAWTNEWHHLVREDFSLDTSSTFIATQITFGPAFWVHAFYTYVIYAAALKLVLQTLLRSPREYRGQLILFLIATLIPISANIMHIWGIYRFPIDPTPIAFTLTGALIAWALFRFQFLELVPVAYDLVVKSMSDAVLVLDTQSRILDLNPAARQLINHPQTEIIGKQLTQIMPEQEAFLLRFRDVTELQAEIEVRIEQHQRYFDLRISPLYDRRRRFNGRLIVLHDITPMKQIQQELRRAKDEAEAANRTKSTFLANMSHELRTPLNAIIGYSDLMIEGMYGPMTEKQKQRMERVIENGHHLLKLINDVLDISKIEAGKMELFLESFELSPLLSDILTDVQHSASERDNRIITHIPLNLGIMQADKTKVQQVLLNILSNASKFTEHGEINFRVEQDTSRIRFIVKDTGIGMNEEQIQNLFIAFTQADASTTRQFGGTGLGLAISRHYCEMMSGSIQVSSSPGQGSTFTVELPLNVIDNSPKLTAPTLEHAPVELSGN
ncbi:MAG: PAS domain-containing protein, partial [Anaerolineae bacterium]|nr:PAS domain-containing protein [Anaerolineae bacterium]